MGMSRGCYQKGRTEQTSSKYRWHLPRAEIQARVSKRKQVEYQASVPSESRLRCSVTGCFMLLSRAASLPPHLPTALEWLWDTKESCRGEGVETDTYFRLSQNLCHLTYEDIKNFDHRFRLPSFSPLTAH